MQYFPQLKSTSAELKALTNIYKKDSNRIIPILQLTKPRIGKSDPIDSLEKHIERSIKAVGKNKSVILGITNDETFQDANLNQYILDSSQGYLSWRTRLGIINKQFSNCRIIPNVVGEPKKDFLRDYVNQIHLLGKEFDSVAIRLPASLNDEFNDLGQIIEILGLRDLPNESYLIFDFGYVLPTMLENFKKSLRLLDERLIDLNVSSKCIPLFSSCPTSFPMKKKETKVVYSIPMIEYLVLDYVSGLQKLEYGDYGYIHPKRQEGGGFWYPRVDYPCSESDRCYYTRYFNKQTWKENRKLRINTTTSNDIAYRELSEVIIESDCFINDKVNSWGKEQLISNATKIPITGKSPQHYISIRSNIHLEHIKNSLLL